MLGAAIPGTAIIVGLSVLVPSGVLKLYPLLASATAGAIIGDGFAFWLGHRYHREIADRWPFKKFPALIEKSEAFFHRHGGKSVFLARFTPGVRAFVPLVAGITQMSAGRFYAVNILSALVWAPVHILPGVFAGAFAASQGAAGTRLIVLLIILAAAAWLMLRLTRYAILRAVPLVMYAVEMLRARAKQTDNLASRLVLRLMGPTEGELPILALLIAILIGAAWLFFGIAEDVITGDPLIVFDKSVFDFLQGLRTRAVDAVMIGSPNLATRPSYWRYRPPSLYSSQLNDPGGRQPTFLAQSVEPQSSPLRLRSQSIARGQAPICMRGGASFPFPVAIAPRMLRFTGS